MPMVCALAALLPLAPVAVRAAGEPGTVKWSSGLIAGNNFDSAASLGPNGRIYVQKQDGKLYAFTADGAQMWNLVIGNGGCGMVTAPAIAANGTIYAASCGGVLYAVTDNDTSAAIGWQYPAAGAVALANINSSPAIGAKGNIYFGCADGKLYAVSPPATGDAGVLKWTYQAATSVDSSPAIGADGTIYLAATYGYFYALQDAGDHAALSWRYPAADVPIEPIQSSPALGADGTVYFIAGNGNAAHLYALNPGGTLKWKYSSLVGGAGAGSPVIGADAGTIYFGTETYAAVGGRLYAVADGGASASEKWSYEVRTEGPDIYGIQDTPAVDTNGVVYFGASDGWVYALTDGGTSATLKWRCPVTTVYPDGTFARGNIISSPLIGPDGTVYIGSAGQDQFYAINGDSQGTAWYSPWPTLHYNAARTGQSLADLKVSGVGYGQVVRRQGSTMKAAVFTVDDGGAGVQVGAANGPSVTMLMLFPYSPGLVRAAGVVPLGLVRAHRSVTQIATVKIPSGTMSGYYRVKACADASLSIAETNDNNNCGTGVELIYVGAIPDLRENITSLTPASARPRVRVLAVDVARNAGTATAPASQTNYYLSKYPVLTTGYRFLGRRQVPSLPPGTASRGGVSFIVPSVAAGSYHLLVCADALKEVREAFENNNCMAQTFTVRP